MRVTFHSKSTSDFLWRPRMELLSAPMTSDRTGRDGLLRNRIAEGNRKERVSGPCGPHNACCGGLILFLAGAMGFASIAIAGKAETHALVLPDAPQTRNASHGAALVAGPCQVRRAGGAMVVTAAEIAQMAADIANPEAGMTVPPHTLEVPCPPYVPLIDWYARFLVGPKVKPMTPKEKGWLAVRNVGDPFNGITILGSSAIAVGSNAHSPYGPGMGGFGRYVGVSYTQDITGEFFGTFLIPSIVHQDPHYHRMPAASMKRRIAHCLYQVVWTQGDDGGGMPNYADLAGFAIDDAIANLYVPGRKTALPASAARYGTTLATAPIDNFVSEFLPDVARHIHIQIVVIQRIINQVARTDATTGQP